MTVLVLAGAEFQCCKWKKNKIVEFEFSYKRMKKPNTARK